MNQLDKVSIWFVDQIVLYYLKKTVVRKQQCKVPNVLYRVRHPHSWLPVGEVTLRLHCWTREQM